MGEIEDRVKYPQARRGEFVHWSELDWSKERKLDPLVDFTEDQPGLQQLHSIAQQQQLSPSRLKLLSLDELIYLDGHQLGDYLGIDESLPDDVVDLRKHKLYANAIRARAELDRRFASKQANRSLFVSVAAVVVSVVAIWISVTSSPADVTSATSTTSTAMPAAPTSPPQAPTSTTMPAPPTTR